MTSSALSRIAADLRYRVADLCAELLPRGCRRGRQWRAGSLAGGAGDAVAVELAGPNRGLYYDFRSGEGGDALKLVAAAKFNGNLAVAADWARAWLGQPADNWQQTRSTRRGNATPLTSGRRAEGLSLFLAARPELAGSPVEHYLTRERGIPAEQLGRWPRALRYHPGIWNGESRRYWPAMIAAIVDMSGRTVAAHLTWLEIRSDGRVAKAPLANPKMTYGSWKGGSIRLSRGGSGKPWKEAPAGDRLVIAEGIEDGLSCAVADPTYRVIAAVNLSNIANLIIPPAIEEIVIAGQNDPWWHERLDRPHPASRGVDRAVRALIGQGKEVRIARAPRGKDMNDLLRACG